MASKFSGRTESIPNIIQDLVLENNELIVGDVVVLASPNSAQISSLQSEIIQRLSSSNPLLVPSGSNRLDINPFTARGIRKASFVIIITDSRLLVSLLSD